MVSPWQEGLEDSGFSALNDFMFFSVDPDGELALGGGVGTEPRAV